jgi:hypothetical protein
MGKIYSEFLPHAKHKNKVLIMKSNSFTGGSGMILAIQEEEVGDLQ